MKVQSISLRNFRSFGSSLTTVVFADLTALIGVNGSGKTALLWALSRMFGIAPGQKGLKKSDFHIPPSKDKTPPGSISLTIELRLAFPELAEQQTGASTDAVPPCFKQMLIDSAQGDPFCRVRLEGTWTATNTVDGEIEEKLFWITTADEKFEDSDKVPFRPHERGLIHVLYVPASRDPSKEVRSLSSSLLGRLLRATEWSDKNKTYIPELSKKIETALQGEVGVKTIQSRISKAWQKVHDDALYAEPRLQFGTKTLDEVLARLDIAFGPSFDDADHLLDRLSEGQKSLFYFALAVAVFDVERSVVVTQAGTLGISRDALSPPALTLLAVEEPENHLAPQFLGRIMQLLSSVAESPGGQVVLSSHSSSILSRVDPADVRYFRLVDDPGKSERSTAIARLTLPAATDEAHKYVKEAVRAYPELYFARLVILGEGDSEEVILPRLLRSYALSLDGRLISVVPLGGRHVNHFWRLLADLKIPFVTLLDLDKERAGGGWGRIQNVCKQLLAIGVPRSPLLDLDGGELLSDSDLENMHERTVDDLPMWLDELERHGVFFSQPLDLDLMMLEAFESEYKGVAGPKRGPRIPKTSDPNYADRIKKAARVVLGEEGGDGSTYEQSSQSLFPWYSYLFLGRGKPSTHVAALASIDDDLLKARMPAPLQRLAESVTQKL
jgi:putative ATP-dependent endonuclease of the OLD family